MCSKERLSWKAGLQNVATCFLSAEDFGNDLNCCAKGLTRKQVWTLELNQDESVFMKSHTDKYLTTDKLGDVKCNQEQRTEDGKFVIEFSPDGSGRWAFKSEKYGTYLTGRENKVVCMSRKVTEEELWFVPMAIHPQIVLSNKRRKRYFALEENEIRCRNIVPWGANAILTLEYYNGKYLIKVCDNRYLHKNGHLTDSREPEARFTLELRVNQESNLDGIAFKDNEGKYLAGVGAMAILKSRNKKISDDELFHVEESQPQIVLESAANGNHTSIKAGFELWASTKQTSEKEIVQIDYDKKSKQWYFQTSENKYWCLNENNGIEATATSKSPECLFHIHWMNGTIALTASNGKYLGVKPNGQLVAKSDKIGDRDKFYIKIVNRPIFVLKCGFGFVGKKKALVSKPEYMCNKSEYEVLTLIYHEKGKYHIKGDNDKYWNMHEEAIVAMGNTPEEFVLEFVGQSRVAILAPNNKYVNSQKTGMMGANSEEIKKTSFWEF